MSNNLFYLFYLSPYYLFYRVIFSLVIIFFLFLLLFFDFIKKKKESKHSENKKQNNLLIIQSIILVFVTSVLSVWISSTPNIIPSDVNILNKTELLNLTSIKKPFILIDPKTNKSINYSDADFLNNYFDGRFKNTPLLLQFEGEKSTIDVEVKVWKSERSNNKIKEVTLSKVKKTFKHLNKQYQIDGYQLDFICE